MLVQPPVSPRLPRRQAALDAASEPVPQRALGHDGGQQPSRCGRERYGWAGGVLQPLFVVALGLEQVAVPFNDSPGLGEDARKLLSEVAVGEVNPTHAARE